MTLHGKKEKEREGREGGKERKKVSFEVFTDLIYMPGEQQLEIVPELHGLE